MSVLHHTEFGRPDAPPLVFLHGFMGSGEDWSAVTDRLVLAAPGRGYRMVAIDLPGHGRSVGLADDQYTWEGALAAVATTLDFLGIERCRMTGYSMGGRLALAFALRNPRKIARLVLIGASAGLRDGAERRRRRALDARRAAEIREDFHGFVTSWYQQDLFSSLERRPHLRQALVTTRLQNDPLEVARAIEAFSPGTMPDLWPELDHIGAPTLAIAGSLDERYERLAYRMSAAGLPIMPLTLPHSGHMPHLEHPRLLADAISDFCRDALLGRRHDVVTLAA